jgi:2-methylisocitrate lyase-like PEP mutase family enzyme
MVEQTQHTKGAAFRKLHQGPEILLLPNAWDVASAVLMEQAGFPAIATTSSGVALANGFPDGEHIGRSRMLEIVARIAERVKVPVSADLEGGYGPQPDDVAETIRQAIGVGVVGANIEDSAHAGNQPLVPTPLAAERVRAGASTAKATGVPFVLNARIDVYLRDARGNEAERFAETIRRAHAYRDAGADSLFIPGVSDPTTIRRLATEIGLPLNVLGAFSGRSAPPLHELQALGVRRVTLGGSLAMYGWAMVLRALAEVRSTGRFEYATHAMSNAELNRLMRETEAQRA